MRDASTIETFLVFFCTQLSRKIGGGSGIKEKPAVFLCIPLTLHYLCSVMGVPMR